MKNVNDLDDFYLLQAVGYVRRHEGSHLNRALLVQAVAESLQVGFDLPVERSERLALRALCEFESAKTSLYLDLDQSTSAMLVFNDTKRQVRRVFSVLDIARFLSTAELAPVRTRSYADAMSGRSLPVHEGEFSHLSTRVQQPL